MDALLSVSDNRVQDDLIVLFLGAFKASLIKSSPMKYGVRVEKSSIHSKADESGLP